MFHVFKIFRDICEGFLCGDANIFIRDRAACSADTERGKRYLTDVENIQTDVATDVKKNRTLKQAVQSYHFT